MKVALKVPSAAQMLRDVQTIDRNLRDARRRATNATARKATPVLQAEMRSVFDRPTRYALDAFRTEFASASDPSASAAVMVKGPQDTRSGGAVPPQSFLRAQILGGERRFKRSEAAMFKAGILPRGWRIVPGKDARLDASGNMSAGQIVQIMSYLQVFRDGARRANSSERSRASRLRGTARQAGSKLFVIRPSDRGGLPPGVYERQSAGTKFVGPVSGRPRPLMIFVSGAQYRRRFDFVGVLERHAEKAMPEELDRVLASQRWPGGKT